MTPPTQPRVVRVDDAATELVPLVSVADRVMLELADRLGADVVETSDGRPAVTWGVADAILRGVALPEVRG